MTFRTTLGSRIFKQKYARYEDQTWSSKARDLAHITRVAEDAVLEEDLFNAVNSMEFMPGGRYIYYAGRDAKFVNNCFLFKSQEDTREAWATLCYDVTAALMSGGGVGNDYSVFRAHGEKLGRTGGEASGPIPLMQIVNEIGRNVKQGGSRRSAIYASLNWQHGDVEAFQKAKNWHEMPIAGAFKSDGSPFTIADAKEADFNYPAPLDMTNISLNYDTDWYNYTFTAVGTIRMHHTFLMNVEQAMRTGEAGMSFNMFGKDAETARNACCEVVSADDGDVCNLGSVNMSRIDTIERFAEVVEIGTKFLLCGTIYGELPTEKIGAVREKNRRLGLGLMGIHEWLLKRGYGYEVVPELHKWLAVYRDVSDRVAREFADVLGVSHPVAVRAIAPTGTIGIIAGTTTGIEPIYAVAYKRRTVGVNNTWNYEYCIDATAETVIQSTGCDPDSIETAITLAEDPERRIKFQADIQDYVDMAISSTLNLPAWGTEHNNADRVHTMAHIIAKYAKRLRGLTFYPDGSRGGQPITAVPYSFAKEHVGAVYEENDSCKGGVCGI